MNAIQSMLLLLLRLLGRADESRVRAAARSYIPGRDVDLIYFSPFPTTECKYSTPICPILFDEKAATCLETTPITAVIHDFTPICRSMP